MPNAVSTVNVLEMDFFIVVAQLVLSRHTLACLASDVGIVATHVFGSMFPPAAAVPSGGGCRQSSRTVCSAHSLSWDGGELAAVGAHTVSDWLSQ
jgi:hypothetical protein